jgi:hypothetical protein
MNEVLTLDELKARYPDEHLLLVDYVTNEFGQVTGGRVLCHSKEAEEMWRQAIELRPKSSAHVFTGTMPEHIALNL